MKKEEIKDIIINYKKILLNKGLSNNIFPNLPKLEKIEEDVFKYIGEENYIDLLKEMNEIKKETKKIKKDIKILENKKLIETIKILEEENKKLKIENESLKIIKRKKII